MSRTPPKKMLIDANLMKHFENRVYYPLLNYLPKKWMKDFNHIFLRFQNHDYCIAANYHEATFHINIDLSKMADITFKQVTDNKVYVEGEEGRLQEQQVSVIVFQYFGNIAYGIIRAFYGYNKDRHPDFVEGTDAQKLAMDFMNYVAERARKDYYKRYKYTI